MATILEIDETFPFTNIKLSKPNTSGFIKLTNGMYPLYVKCPKSKTKQGIVVATGKGKKNACELLFESGDEVFMGWMDGLEQKCKDVLTANGSAWFSPSLDKSDIDDSFASSLRPYKSGKFYLLKTGIQQGTKVFDERGTEVGYEILQQEGQEIICVLEVLGIKCAQKSFQMEFEIKQMMTLEIPDKLFNQFVLHKPQTTSKQEIQTNVAPQTSIALQSPVAPQTPIALQSPVALQSQVALQVPVLDEEEDDDDTMTPVALGTGKTDIVLDMESHIKEDEKNMMTEQIEIEEPKEEVQAPLLEVEEEDDEDMKPVKIVSTEENVITLTRRNDLYYDMYKEALRKAKIARDLAITTYLEAKKIRDTYLVDEMLSDDDDEDFLENLETVDMEEEPISND